MKQFLYSIWMMFSLVLLIQWVTGDYDFWVGLLMLMPMAIGLSHTGRKLHERNR